MKPSIKNFAVGGALAALLLGGGVAYAQSDGSTTSSTEAPTPGETPPSDEGTADDGTADAPHDGENCHLGERREEIDTALAEQLGITIDELRAARQAARDAVDDELGEPERPESRPDTDEEREALREQFEARKDLYDQKLAEQLGVTVDELKAARLAVLEARLTEQVAAGEITQEEADERLEAVRNGEVPEDGLGGRGPGGFGFGGRGPGGHGMGPR